MFKTNKNDKTMQEYKYDKKKIGREHETSTMTPTLKLPFPLLEQKKKKCKAHTNREGENVNDECVRE